MRPSPNPRQRQHVEPEGAKPAPKAKVRKRFCLDFRYDRFGGVRTTTVTQRYATERGRDEALRAFRAGRGLWAKAGATLIDLYHE